MQIHCNYSPISSSLPTLINVFQQLKIIRKRYAQLSNNCSILLLHNVRIFFFVPQSMIQKNNIIQYLPYNYSYLETDWNMKMKLNKCLLCYSIRYQTGSLIWVLKDMFQFFRFLPKSDYVLLWCLLPVVDEDCENVKTMSGFRTCPHFPLNPIIVNFNLCFFIFHLFMSGVRAGPHFPWISSS